MITKCFKKVVNSTISSLFAGIVVIMAMFMVVACEKEETVIDKSPSLRDTKSILYNLKVDEDGIIVFKDFEEYKQCIMELEKLNQSERLNWERKIGFESNATGLLNAAREINSAQTEEEFFQNLKKNSKYYYLEKLNNGDGFVQRTSQTTLYSSFSNTDGLFIIQDSIYRVTNKGFLICTDINNKSEIKSRTENELELLTSDSEYSVFNFMCMPNSEVKEFYGDVDTLRGERLYDPSGWRNDRWVKIKVMAYYLFNSGYNYYGYVQIQVYGKKKNIWGNWVDYETILSHRDVSYALKYQIVGGSLTWHPNAYTFPDAQSSENELEFVQSRYFDDDIHMSTSYPARFYFESLFAEGSSRGMNNLWAQINY